MHEARGAGLSLLPPRPDVASVQEFGTNAGSRAAFEGLHRPAGHQEHAQWEDDVSDEVKAGQVWQHKSTSTQWVVGENPWTQGERRWWGLRRIGPDGAKSVPEWLLTDHYILVKGAP